MLRMLYPVPYHPLLTRTPLHHQSKAEVGIFGHLHLHAPSSVPADDWTILQKKWEKIISETLILKKNTFFQLTLHNLKSLSIILMVDIMVQIVLLYAVLAHFKVESTLLLSFYEPVVNANALNESGKCVLLCSVGFCIVFCNGGTFTSSNHI